MNNFSSNYSTRLRSRTKQPVYTSDKRAKFTQRETVSLSVYYIYLWDPGYIQKFQREVINYSVPIHKAPDVTFRSGRDLAGMGFSLASKPTPLSIQQPCPPCGSRAIDLATILAEGTKSMESSSEKAHDTSRETAVMSMN
uniref:Uncharacterized protein n=1 Tax=Angiostrongylus cantonensis TaxID=6313 RepID=A0A158PBQ6_ANGCA